MKSKPFLLVFLSVILSNITLYGQSYFEYSYDDSGNRIQRKVIIVAAPPEEAAAVVPDTASAKEDALSFVSTQDSAPSFKAEDTLTKTISTSLLIADVYPNPTYGMVNVVISEQGTFNGVLYNMEGKAVMQQIFNSGQNIIDISNVGDGQFILRITNSEGRKQEFKIIKKS
jgi:hypothetical protein